MCRRGTNIYKRKDGRWEGRYLKGYDENEKRILGYVYGRTYREALEKKQKAQALYEEKMQKKAILFDKEEKPNASKKETDGVAAFPVHGVGNLSLIHI